MCLTTSKIYHKKGKNGKVKSFVAQEDILVYKFLERDECGYFTPFQYMIIDFSKGKFEYERVSMPYETCTRLNCKYALIYEGIHTYSAKDIAFKYKYSSMHYSVIPKGSRFYIGNDGDIVSDNLIVYRQKRCFDKHYPNIINAVEYIHKYIKNK